MQDSGPVTETGTVHVSKMADLRDPKVVRASYLHQLLDLEGSDLKKVYEPISDQIGYVLCFLILFMVVYFAWVRYKGWKEENTRKFLPYKIVKPPSSMIADQQGGTKGDKKKRVCAVIGGTGFIGSHVVDELVRRKDYYVFVLGRKFRPERTNPDADCLIQVDMLDLDGLTSALQGVDSVISAAAIIPNAFHTADEVYRKNRSGLSNILKAAEKAGVKNFIHVSGFPPANMKLRDPVFTAFLNSFYAAEKDIIEANDSNGLKTCVISPTNIIGLNSPFLDGLISGQLKSLPMVDKLPTSFMPAEYLASALVNAEQKLNAQENEVVGKLLLLRGEPMSWKTFLTLPGWPQKISDTPRFVMNAMIRINSICATLFSWAPFGADLVPGLFDLLGFVETDVSEEKIQDVYRILDVGPPNPPMAEYVKELVEKYKSKNGDKKKQ